MTVEEKQESLMGKIGIRILIFSIVSGILGVIVLSSATQDKGALILSGGFLLLISASLSLTSTIFGIIGLSRKEIPMASSVVSVTAIPISGAVVALAFVLSLAIFF